MGFVVDDFAAARADRLEEILFQQLAIVAVGRMTGPGETSDQADALHDDWLDIVHKGDVADGEDAQVGFFFFFLGHLRARERVADAAGEHHARYPQRPHGSTHGQSL